MIISSPRRRRVRPAIAAIAIAALAATAPVMFPGTAHAAETLGASAAETGRYFGAAVVRTSSTTRPIRRHWNGSSTASWLRMDRGGVPHRQGRRPWRQALLQRRQHRRHQRQSTAIYNMVVDFRARGVPIDCVGFQSHLGSDSNLSTYQAKLQRFSANLQRFSDLGVDVQITELDIGGSGSAQADVYRPFLGLRPSGPKDPMFLARQ